MQTPKNVGHEVGPTLQYLLYINRLDNSVFVIEKTANIFVYHSKYYKFGILNLEFSVKNV